MEKIVQTKKEKRENKIVSLQAIIRDTPFGQKLFDLLKWVFRNGTDTQKHMKMANL